MNAKFARRYFKFAIIGLPSFAIDIALLFIFTEVLHIHPVVSAGIAFMIVESLSYAMCRTFVFPETKRAHHEGYWIFIFISLIGIFSVMGLMHLFVVVWHHNYLLSRIGIGFFTGVWSYLANLFINFRVSEHDRS